MNKIMYKATYGNNIIPVEIIRETASSVWLKNESQYRKKKCDSWNFFDTFDEAKAFLIEKFNKEISNLENELKYKQQTLKK